MRTTQYIKQEKVIAAASSSDIRQRWLFGLRLLRDPDAFNPGSGQLKPGRLDELVKAAKAADLRLSRIEIQYRLRCARAYPTEDQIAQATVQFPHWTALVAAGFPAYEAPLDEPPADHRTDAERDHDRARALMDLTGEQDCLFPLRDFEPVTTTLKDLLDYTNTQDDITARFAARGRKRRAYLERLIAAADNDLSMTWLEAANRLPEETEADRPEPAMV